MPPKKFNGNDKYISIYHHTVHYCNKKKFPIKPPVLYDYRSDNLSDQTIFDHYVAHSEPLIVTVENIDSFDAARNMLDIEDDVLVLNLASHKCSGGGVAIGCRAQEEDLYRKSNYFQANNPDFYPLGVTYAVYSPIVHIVKDSKYNLLSNPVAVSCLAIAAIRNPKIRKLPDGSETYLNDDDKRITQEKIDAVFKIALVNNHQNLVLGALGCGAFHNPPDEIALMFKNSVAKYGPYFKKIVFAVLCTDNTINYEIFKKVFG